MLQSVPEALVRGGAALDDNGSVLAYLFMKADVIAPSFNQHISQLVDRFNRAAHPVDLGLDAEEFPLYLRNPETSEYLDGPNVVKVWGAKKTLERSWQKVRSPDDYRSLAFPQSASLLDIERMQLQFQDPYALAVFFFYMKQTGEDGDGKVVRIKNRFLEDSPLHGYRDLE